EQDVQRQAHREALDLDVAFLHDVEQGNLHLACEVRQLVHGEDAAVRTREETVVDGALVTQRSPEPGRPDGVYVPDDVRDRGVGGRELLEVPGLTRQPGDGCGVTALLDDAF